MIPRASLRKRLRNLFERSRATLLRIQFRVIVYNFLATGFYGIGAQIYANKSLVDWPQKDRNLLKSFQLDTIIIYAPFSYNFAIKHRIGKHINIQWKSLIESCDVFGFFLDCLHSTNASQISSRNQNKYRYAASRKNPKTIDDDWCNKKKKQQKSRLVRRVSFGKSPRYLLVNRRPKKKPMRNAIDVESPHVKVKSFKPARTKQFNEGFLTEQQSINFLNDSLVAVVWKSRSQMKDREHKFEHVYFISIGVFELTKGWKIYFPYPP